MFLVTCICKCPRCIFVAFEKCCKKKEGDDDKDNSVNIDHQNCKVESEKKPSNEVVESHSG